jgi:hypothetical protein
VRRKACAASRSGSVPFEICPATLRFSGRWKPLRPHSSRADANKRAAIQEIAFSPTHAAKRPPLKKSLVVEVFRRDRFTCRYCGARTVARPVLRVFSALFPREFSYHPHGKNDEAHPACWMLMASVDHVHPVTGGGESAVPKNLVCACWPCNLTKSNLPLERLGWELRPIPKMDWDGFTGVYSRLWVLAGGPNRRGRGG